MIPNSDLEARSFVSASNNHDSMDYFSCIPSDLWRLILTMGSPLTNHVPMR